MYSDTYTEDMVIIRIPINALKETIEKSMRTARVMRITINMQNTKYIEKNKKN
jgi:hypothetical protein